MLEAVSRDINVSYNNSVVTNTLDLSEIKKANHLNKVQYLELARSKYKSKVLNPPSIIAQEKLI